MSIKIFQISSEVNVGSVGKIAEQIGCSVLHKGWESYIAYGREISDSSSQLIKIGNKADFYSHVLYTRFTDKHALASKNATIRLVKKINQLKPDIVQL